MLLFGHIAALATDSGLLVHSQVSWSVGLSVC